MNENFINIRTRLLILFTLEIVILILFHTFWNPWLYIVQYVFILLDIIIAIVMFILMYNTYKTRVFSVSRILGRDAQDAFEFGKITIVTFDDNHIINWISEGFSEGLLGENILDVFPKLKDIIEGKTETIYLNIEDKNYEISSMGNENVLFFKDTTDFYDLLRQNKENKIVLGIAHLDNYAETTQYEEEQKIALIDANIRQEVVDWADNHNMYVRRIKPDSYLLILSEVSFELLEKERFSILHKVRDEARKMDNNITLSLAFARLSNNLKELEEMTNHALEVAQGRGGDQVVINTQGEPLRYYGGTTEAIQKRSKVRVRVLAQNLGNLISDSSNVIIVGHKMMDFDCLGSALAISTIAASYQKNVYIVINKDDVDPSLSMVLEENNEKLSKRHTIIEYADLDKIINEDSLLIMVDHHNIAQTQFEDLPERIKNIVVIDHHRRTGEFGFKPALTYIEPSASSACELMVELLPYHKSKIHLPILDATIMYTGVLVDTNRFRNRSGSRTFEAASELRKFGASIEMAENMLRDEYENFEIKNKILSKSELYLDEYVLVPYKEALVNRVTMSKVADEIIQVRDVEASFVIANVDEDTVAISARSKGELNVQVVMERMGGGGHFTGAAAQIRGMSINEVVEKLKEVIVEVKEES